LINKNPLCKYNDYDYPLWYWRTCFGALGGFILTSFILLARIIYSKPGFECVPFYTAFNIAFMGTIATALSLYFNWGGVCIDVLGFELIIIILDLNY